MAQLNEWEKRYQLEQLIDKTSLEAVLYALSSICSEKADHIRTSYQDCYLAKSWAKAGERINKVADSIPNL